MNQTTKRWKVVIFTVSSPSLLAIFLIMTNTTLERVVVSPEPPECELGCCSRGEDIPGCS